MSRPTDRSGPKSPAGGEPGGWWDLPPFTAKQNARLLNQRRRLRLVLGLGTVVLAGLLVVTLVATSRNASAGHRPGWLVWVAVLVVPLSLLAGVVVVVDRRAQRPGPGLWLTATADPREVQRVVRQLRRGERIDGADRTLASAFIARQRGAAPHLRWVYLAISVMYLGCALLPSSPLRWFFAVLAVLNIVFFFLVSRGGKQLADKAAAQGITAADPGPPWAASMNQSSEATS